MATTVINIRDAPADWRYNPKYVFIGRPAYLGNPYKIGIHGDRQKVIDLYRLHIGQLILDDTEMFKEYMHTVVKDGILVCYCKPKACHGDILAELADTEY